TTPTTSVTDEQLKRLIDHGVVDALAARDAGRSRNGKDSHDSGTSVRRQAPPAHECTYLDFMKYKPLYFKGTEGVVELTQWFKRMETVLRISNCTMDNQIKFATYTLLGSALTWWNSHVKTVGHDDAIEFATKLMDKKIRTFAERRSENKRKQDDNQQQQNKRQNTGRVYGAGSGEKKPYKGSKPLCSKCNYHHDGQCAPKCHECNRVGHLAHDCRRHFKRECPKLKKNNHDNQGGNGNAPVKVYAVGCARTNPDSNVVTAHVTIKEVEDKSEKKRLEDVPIVRNFPEVFPEDLPGLPPTRQVEFQIDLIPGAAPVAWAPYRLALSKMKELSNQL
ncbi:putative reverse transcriptase domain-containing protein, partial [Tanacetum coccineum]